MGYKDVREWIQKVDAMGELNARLAAETEDVRWCVAGRVVPL